jgi:hypothetical protein
MKGEDKKQKRKGRSGLPSSLAKREQLLRSPFRDIAKEMSEILQSVSFKSPLEQLRDSIPAVVIRDPLEQFREVAKAIDTQNIFKELSKSMRTSIFASSFEELQKVAESVRVKSPMQKIAERIKSTQLQLFPFERFELVTKDTNIRDSLSELFDSVRHSYSNSAIYDNIFVDSKAVNLFEESYKDILTRFIIAESATGEKEKAAYETAISVKKTINKHPTNALILNYLPTIIALAIFIFNLYLDRQSEQRITSEINKSYQILVEKIEELKIKDNEVYLEVKKLCNLREKPTTKNSKIIAVLQPQLIVRFLEKENNWFRVEYFDDRTESTKSGWCYGRYITIVKNKP